MHPPRISKTSSSRCKVELETTRFGVLEVDDRQAISFPQGLIGFSEQHRFLLLDHSPGSPFHWLQSLQRGDLAFPIVNPDHFVEGYNVIIPKGLEKNLGAFKPADLWLGVIVTFPHNSEPPTLNLRAPLILNTRSRTGIQTVMEARDVPVRLPIDRIKDAAER